MPCSPWPWQNTARPAAKQPWRARLVSTHAYTGNNQGNLRYSFTGKNQTDLANITRNLGEDWFFLETLYRIYSTAGFNIAHVDVTANLCAEHNITYADIDRIEAVVNWLETEYPSPAFPVPGSDGKPRVGATQYFTAYGAVNEGLPAAARSPARPGRDRPAGGTGPDAARHADPDGPPHTVRPRITIFLKNGESRTKEGTGREFIWDFETLVARIQPIATGLAISSSQYDQLIDTCRHLDHTDNAAQQLIARTVK